VQGPRQDRDGPEQLRVFEPDLRRPGTTHREALDGPPLALGDGPVRGVDVGDEVLNDHGLHGRLAIGGINVAAGPHAVDADDDHRGHLAGLDRLVQPAGELTGAGLAAASAVQPVDDGIALVLGLVIVGWQVDEVAHLAVDGRALEGAVLHPGRLGLVGLDPGRGLLVVFFGRLFGGLALRRGPKGRQEYDDERASQRFESLVHDEAPFSVTQVGPITSGRRNRAAWL
jgi:hypothetical protein